MTENSMFETLLASTVHDMKNSLGFLMNQLNEVSQQYSAESSAVFSNIEYEANRVNILLLELLSLYKLEKKQLPVNKQEVEIDAFLEDCVALYSRYAQNKKIKLSTEYDETLVWFFDSDLVGIVINNIIGNCIRYARREIRITAKNVNNFLVLMIEDDGEGYPESMQCSNAESVSGVDRTTGSTGLGLYFSSLIAKNHRKQGAKGSIDIDNCSVLQGGRFQIKLP